MAGRARPGSARSPGRRRASGRSPGWSGTAAPRTSAPRCRASSHMCGCPVSFIRRVIALATTSRGARSASSCDALHEPVALEVDEERALAADRLGDQRLLAAGVGAEVHHRRVELHELQVAQRRPGPQRERHAVAGRHRGVRGLREHLAEPAAGEHHGPAAGPRPTPSRWPSPITCRVTPAIRRRRRRRRAAGRRRARAGSTSISGARSTAAIRARWISAPVASPPACAIRSRWWPPSRVSDSTPSGSWSKSVPSAISSRTASGPSVTRTRTASGSQAPAPATRVSRSCCSGVSPGPRAAAMPPCAHCVEPALSTSLVTTRILSTWPASRSAAVSPAMPEPMTTTSAVRRPAGRGRREAPGDPAYGGVQVAARLGSASPAEPEP